MSMNKTLARALFTTAVVLLLVVPAVATGAATPQATEQTGQGGFVDGLFGPLQVLFTTARNLIGAEGPSRTNAAIEQTWGRGSTSYRLGFVVSVVIVLCLGGAGGVSASRARDGGGSNRESG